MRATGYSVLAAMGEGKKKLPISSYAIALPHPYSATASRLGVDARALYRHIQRMNMLRSAASTTTATAYGGSPAGCAR
jgi:hypothetical protein